MTSSKVSNLKVDVKHLGNGVKVVAHHLIGLSLFPIRVPGQVGLLGQVSGNGRGLVNDLTINFQQGHHLEGSAYNKISRSVVVSIMQL